MERTKYLMGSDKFEMMNSMPVPGQQMKAKSVGKSRRVLGSLVNRAEFGGPRNSGSGS